MIVRQNRLSDMRWLAVLIILAGPVLAQGFETRDGHGGPIMGVAVGTDGALATASFDNAVGLWQDQQPNWREGHRAAVNTVIFLPDGRLASGGDDNAVILWSDAKPSHFEGHTAKVMALAVSPDGATLASASWDGTIRLWPLKGGDPTILSGHDGGVNDVTFGPDGTLYSASSDGTLRVWDGSDGRVLVHHGFGINRLVMGPGWLAYGAVDGGTRLVDPVTGAALADYTADRRPILALSYAKGRLAVGDGEGYIMVLDVDEGRVLHDFHAVKRGPVWALAWSEDGQMLHAGGLDPTLFSWPMAAMGDGNPAGAGSHSFLTDPDKMSNGERQFQRKCSICHTLVAGSARRAGPSLHNIFGRQAGTVDDYSYSPVLTGSDIVWDADSIDALFDEGPDHYIPGSKMPMQRIAKPQDRADLIAFLRVATGEDKK